MGSYFQWCLILLVSIGSNFKCRTHFQVWRASVSSPSSESHPGTSLSSASTATAVTVTATTSSFTTTQNSTPVSAGADIVTTSSDMTQPAVQTNG